MRRLAMLGLAGVLGLEAPVIAAPPTTPRAETAHQVRAGDTLGAIAKRYGVTVAALVAANRLPSPSARLRIGQRLVVPRSGAGAGTASAPARSERTAVAKPKEGTRVLPPTTLALAIPDFEDLAPPFLWPVEGPITSWYGWRRHGWHRGIDIKADVGTPIVAAAAGVVIASGVEVRYGRVVKIEHDAGFVTVYAHNAENFVEVGERVTSGARIATVGRTGRATTDHVHFEIRRGLTVYNPLYLLPLPPRILNNVEVDEGEDDDE